MIHTFLDMLFLQILEGAGHECLVRLLREPHQLSGSQALEISLGLRKDELDRVVLRAVRHVVQVAKLQSFHRSRGISAGMHSEVVEKEERRVLADFGPQLLKSFFEFFLVHRSLEDLEVLEAIFLRDSG